MKREISKLDTTVLVAVAGALLVAVIFVVWIFRGADIIVTNKQKPDAVSPMTGLPCAEAAKRPIAVMLASDPEARPLSGIGQADVVFEMPVTPNGITRMMAVYQCSQPKEIGSIRSARQDFIPLAQGVNAIFAHWGGEHDALAALNGHVVDNIDALLYEGSTFYRKTSIPRPHNGFTTLELLYERADNLGYRASASMPEHPHASGKTERNLGTLAHTIAVSWPQNMDVQFTYDAATNTYSRMRGGQPEIDATTGQQVRVGVVIVAKTDATFLRDQYIHVRTTGAGTATIWQGGRQISALWTKQRATDKLAFTDSKGKEIPLEPGTLWIIIDAPLPAINS